MISKKQNRCGPWAEAWKIYGVSESDRCGAPMPCYMPRAGEPVTESPTDKIGERLAKLERRVAELHRLREMDLKELGTELRALRTGAL